jgi:hypothetical protein
MAPRIGSVPWNLGKKIPEADRFWPKVSPEPTSGCWLWAGAYTTTYGTFMRENQRQENAHRVAWELHHDRKIPHGMVICHRCDNPGCVNPAHLFLGTYQDNERDKIAKGRKKYVLPRGRRGVADPSCATRPNGLIRKTLKEMWDLSSQLKALGCMRETRIVREFVYSELDRRRLRAFVGHGRRASMGDLENLP